MTRPLQYITDEELRHFMKTNRAFKQAWLDLRPYLRERNSRGVTKRVFALAWLAGLAHFSHQIEELADYLRVRHEKGVDNMMQDFRRRTGLSILEGREADISE